VANGRNDREATAVNTPEPEKVNFSDVMRRRLSEMPTKSADELAAVGEERAAREKDDVRRDIVRKLSVLKKDVGERLDPFKRATVDTFVVYDPEQEKTLRRVREYVDDIEANVQNGNGAFLIGPPGTGKDHLAVAIAREAVIRLGVSARWLDVATLRSELRDAIKSSTEEKKTLAPYLKADVLILSDPIPPGSGGLSDFQADALFRLIDGRWRECRPTLITANFRTEQEAEGVLGSQVVDRLSHGGLRLRCQWGSFRRRGTHGGDT
tara:strand:+ start:4553 stop:5350 length:798 start_codon:yes stop_codon:yes gene_type:complete